MRTGNAHPLINPYDILKCSNGYVAMGISSDAQWTKFCKAFNVPEWDVEEKYCSNLVRGYHYFGDLRDKLEDLFSKYTMQEIAAICDEALIPGTMCSTTKEALQAADYVTAACDKDGAAGAIERFVLNACAGKDDLVGVAGLSREGL